MEALEMSTQVSVILGFLGAIFSFAVLRPLNNAIVKLEAMFDEVRADLRRSEEMRHRLEIDLARVEQSTKSAHRRLDDLVDICEQTLNIRIPHPRERESGSDNS